MFGVVFVIVLLGWGVFFVCLLWSLEFSCEDHSLQIPGQNKHQVKADGTVQLQNKTKEDLCSAPTSLCVCG